MDTFLKLPHNTTLPDDMDYLFVISFSIVIGSISYAFQFLPLEYLNACIFYGGVVSVASEWLPIHLFQNFATSLEILIPIILIKSFSTEAPASFFSSYILKLLAFLIGAHINQSSTRDDDHILSYLSAGCLLATSCLKGINPLVMVPFLKPAVLEQVKKRKDDFHWRLIMCDLLYGAVFISIGVVIALIQIEEFGDVDVFVINTLTGYSAAKILTEVSEDMRNSIRSIFRDFTTKLLGANARMEIFKWSPILTLAIVLTIISR